MAFLFSPHFQAVDANGLPVAGALLNFYRAGTTSAITSYQDADAVTPHASPVVADASGLFAPIFLDTAGRYKFVLKTSAGVTIQTVDKIAPGQGGQPTSFTTVAALLADEEMAYSGGNNIVVVAGDIVTAQGFRYEVAASDAVDQHLTTAGGVKLYVLEPEVQPQMFGAVGTDDDSAVFDAMAAVGRPALITSGTYTVEGVTFTNSVRGVDRDTCIIHHKAASTTFAMSVAGSYAVRDLTIDGDWETKARVVDDSTAALEMDGDDLTVENVRFRRSLYAAVHFTDFLRGAIRNCIFAEMAPHGGTTGLQTMAGLFHASDKAVVHITGNDLSNTQAASLTAPGGFLASSGDISMVASGNHFYRIGQGSSGNFIGCFDAYQEGEDNIITGNVFEEICYTAVKLSSSKHCVVADNIVNGFDSGDSTTIPAFAIAYRATDQITQKVVVKGNAIGGTVGAGKSGIEVYGASGFNTERVIIEANEVTVPGAAVLVQYADNVKILNNDLKSTAANNAIRTLNLANARIDIRGNTVQDAVGIPIDVSSGCAGALVSISENVLDTGATAIPIRVDGVARARVSNNTLDGFGTSTVRLYNIAGTVVAVGNMTDGAVTLDTTGSTGDITDEGNTWNP